MQRLIFARHGNTFDPGDKTVWVGRETDLPLVARGLAQAEEAALALIRREIQPAVIFTASLRRTRQFAAIVADRLGSAPPVVDRRLDELDYGEWAGRSNDEILAADPAAASEMAGWNLADRWPEQARWGSRQASVMAELTTFIDERVRSGEGDILMVSSNGILRFLPRLLLPLSEQRVSFKMRTGHLGMIERDVGSARLEHWDVPPDSF